jgi:uncharacterized protein
MKIRSITYFFDPRQHSWDRGWEEAGKFIREARPAFESAGYEVQTTRAAAPPFPHLVEYQDGKGLGMLGRQVEAQAGENGYDYVSLGPALPDHLESYDAVLEGLSLTKSVFFSGMMAQPERGVSMQAVQECAKVIQQASTLDEQGFTNLRFAALANVAPGGPFFPASYHVGGEPIFALATESADLAVEAFSRGGSLLESRQIMIESVEEQARRMTGVSHELAKKFGITFGGIDFSLAPFPQVEQSLGTALERAGAETLGLHGSLAAAALLADTLDQASFPRAGFCGLMLPVLEDETLALRAAEGTLTVMDLLLYSAVCGTGLDTVPLAGNVTQDELASVLMDVAALSQRLGKPLTARLMPVPGKSAGEETDFDFPYFKNSRVMALKGYKLGGFLGGEGEFSLTPRL